MMSLSIGARLGPYEIISQVGAGGMGEVYKARDTRLQRIVAIKVLREGVSVGRARLRLEREARAIASVTHPNICALYDIGFENGIQYLVIEYVDGETLADRIHRGPMPPGEVVRRALEVARALEAAHAQGLVHRDLKPGNIMITRDGTKLLDFGLAKVCSAMAELSDETEEGPLTAEGTAVGTPAYMAPEQLHAVDVDGRADIFALGAILYEALTGRRAFGPGGSAANADPQPVSSIRPDVPAALVRVIETCLARDPAARWQSAHEVAAQLQAMETIPALPISRTRTRRARILAAAAALVVAIAGIAVAFHLWPGDPIDRLAVLPLRNVTGNHDLDYLGDGISDSIITNLSQLPQLHVVPRTLSSPFRPPTDPVEAARKLGARAILTGDVLERGDTMAISVELFDAQTKRRLWGERYVRKFSDIFAVQEEIAREVSEKLRLQLTTNEKAKLARHGTNDPEAYRLYLQARHHYANQNEASQRAALNLFQAAIHRDPAYASAYAGLSFAYGTLAFKRWMPQDEARQKQKEYAEKALDLDDSLSEAHTALARIHMGIVEHDYSAAEEELRKALALDPQDAETHLWYGMMLERNRRFVEAERELKTALALDSTILNSETALIQLYVNAGDCARAEAEARRVLAQNRVSLPAHWASGVCAEKNGHFDEAVQHYVRVADLAGTAPPDLARLRNAYAAGGMATFWSEQLALWHEPRSEGKFFAPAYGRAFLEMKTHHYDAALDWLQKSIEAHEGDAAWMNARPEWDPVRDTPRFQALGRRIGFK
jgi:serine/threonine protein kinase/Tfp pilus assembly protein PilF